MIECDIKMGGPAQQMKQYKHEQFNQVTSGAVRSTSHTIAN